MRLLAADRLASRRRQSARPRPPRHVVGHALAWIAGVRARILSPRAADADHADRLGIAGQQNPIDSCRLGAEQ